MSFNSRWFFALTALAVLTQAAGADIAAKKKPREILVRRHLSWQNAGAPAQGTGTLSFPLIKGNSEEVLHPKKEKDDSPKPPEFVQKIRDNMAYKVKDW